jgi:hypothetical protein
MSSELAVALIGLVTAALGVLSAYLSKSKLVVHRHEGLDARVPAPQGEPHVARPLPTPQNAEPPPAGADPTVAVSAVRAPGIVLTVTGGVSAAVMAIGVFQMVRGPGAPAYLDALVLTCFLAAGVVVALAGVSLLSLRRYRLVILGCVLAMFGLFFMSAVGLPVGIWCLIVLRRQEVQAAFGDAADVAQGAS